ncbi:hypothetical protein ACJJTC_019018 [Scirpophaga incertulas]
MKVALRDDVREMVRAEVNSAIQLVKDDFTVTTDFICQEQISLRTDINVAAEKISKLESENIRLQLEKRERYLPCRRVAKQIVSSSRPRNIVCHFFHSTYLNITDEQCRIYMTEHLSPEQKTLDAATRKTARDLNYNFVWVKYGQIYVRKNEATSVIFIKTVDCLKNL